MYHCEKKLTNDILLSEHTLIIGLKFVTPKTKANVKMSKADFKVTKYMYNNVTA